MDADIPHMLQCVIPIILAPSYWNTWFASVKVASLHSVKKVNVQCDFYAHWVLLLRQLMAQAQWQRNGQSYMDRGGIKWRVCKWDFRAKKRNLFCYLSLRSLLPYLFNFTSAIHLWCLLLRSNEPGTQYGDIRVNGFVIDLVTMLWDFNYRIVHLQRPTECAVW